jgi:hypothetical protein
MSFTQGSRGITGGGFIQIEDHDVSALLREGGRCSAANATCGGGTGDDRDFALKKHGRVPLIVFIGSTRNESMTQLGPQACLEQ